MKPVAFDWVKFKKIRSVHQKLYAIGLGPLIGRFILLLTTIGRKSGQKRVTPVQYELIDGDYYVGSARGIQSDWYRNLQANPNVEVQVKSSKFRGEAETVTDPVRIADFLNVRLHNHPLMVGAMMRMHGLPMKPNRAQVEKLAKILAMVVIHPKTFSENLS